MTCGQCRFYQPDQGMWTATGWTRDGESGDCTVEPTKVKRRADDPACRYQEKR